MLVSHIYSTRFYFSVEGQNQYIFYQTIELAWGSDDDISCKALERSLKSICPITSGAISTLSVLDVIPVLF